MGILTHIAVSVKFIRFFCSSDAESIFEKHNYTKENYKQLCEFSLKF